MENTRIGPFQVLERLGANRRQKVFRAIQVEQGREIALKFVQLPPDVAKTKALSRIQRETRILTKLVHPNLVQVYGAGVEGDNIFFAMELVHGEALSRLLTRRGKLAWDLSVEYAKQIARMLQHIHAEEVIHLKLTPDKILVQQDGGIKVSDLRLNRSKKRRWDTGKAAKKLDIAAYLSPEQLVGKAGTAKSDFYSLGVILYEMVTGKLPFELDTMTRLIEAKQTKMPTSISEHTLDCPIWLEKIIFHMLQIDPANRPHSARAIVLALEEVQDIDSSGTGVAEKLTGNFNPLTVGIDKSEARKLLGYEDEVEPKTPIYQKRWAQVASLVVALALIAGFLGFMLKPLTDEQLFAKAQSLVESEDQNDWTTAKLNFINPLQERGEDGEYYDRASALLAQIELNKLRSRLEDGKSSRNTDSAEEKKLFIARDFMAEEDMRNAKSIIRRLLRKVEPDGTQAHVYEIAEEMEIKINLGLDKQRLAAVNGEEDADAAKEKGAGEKANKLKSEKGKANEKSAGKKGDEKSASNESSMNLVPPGKANAQPGGD